MELFFTKLHGNGNDFVLVDESAGCAIPDEMKAEFAALYCDRRFGIGADGVLFLSGAATSDIRMRLFQPDGSEAEMCGNGIRCLAKFALDTGLAGETCTVETPAGVIGVRMGYTDEGFSASIAMPEPQFARPAIPATGEGEFLETIGKYEVRAVNTGVPHAVILVKDLDQVPVPTVAPPIRSHALFPKGANVNFVEVTGPDTIRVRTFERGVEDETWSCGTGATAAAAVVHRMGLTGATVHVETRGGPLTITLGAETRMEGPAMTVFSGSILF